MHLMSFSLRLPLPGDCGRSAGEINRMKQHIKCLVWIFLLVSIFYSACAPHKPIKYAQIFSKKKIHSGEKIELKVLFNGTWRDSGLSVSKGEKYLIKATGKWRWKSDCNFTGPEGVGMYSTFCRDWAPWNQYRVLADYPQSALVAKLTSPDSEKIFAVGESIEIDIETDGSLSFHSNIPDEWLYDSSDTGELKVTINRIDKEDKHIVFTKKSKMKDTFHQNSISTLPITKNWAVIIGISKYQYSGQNGLTNLIFADDDAKAFARTLRNLGWNESHIKLLKNEEATKRNIEIALESWLTKAGPNDQIILFWAGHGFPDPEDPEKVYFACYDTDISIPATGYRMDRVRSALEEIKSKNVILLADTCHAGKLITRGDGSRGISIVPEINKMARDQKVPKGWIFMVGADTDRQAIEHTSWTNGAFTHSLLKGLNGEADGFQSAGAKDAIVTMGELKSYMNTAMPDETQKVLGVAKRPVITTSTGDPDIWNLTLHVNE